MTKPEYEGSSAPIQRFDAAAHQSFVLFGESRKLVPVAVLDESITVCKADPSGRNGFSRETARLRNALPGDLVQEIQHIGSTAVPGLDAKPIVDLMVGIREPGQIAEVVERLERLGYESLGEAGVPGRWALRKRDVAQPSNIAVVAYEGDGGSSTSQSGITACECRGCPGLRLGKMGCRQQWRGYVARLLRRQARNDRNDSHGGARFAGA